MIFYYIRHGDPIYNPDSLTPLGKRQAEAAARRLSRYGLDQIYASSSNRAISTAKPTSEILKKDITILDWCNESYAWQSFACEDETGQRKWLFQQERIRNEFVSERIRSMGENWVDDPLFLHMNLREPLNRYKTQIDEFFRSFGYVHDRDRHIYISGRKNDSRIALFAHQGFGILFLSCVLDIPYPMFSTCFDLSHSSITVLHFDDTKETVIPKILQLSNDSHIYADGLPTNYNNSILL